MDRLGTPLTELKRPSGQREYQESCLARVNELRARIALGGGEAAIARQHKQGKLTARERVMALLDPDSFHELASFAGEGMYEEEGGVPGAGTVMGSPARSWRRKASSSRLMQASMKRSASTPSGRYGNM